MVAAEFRDVHVSIYPAACHEAEGVQEVVFHPAASVEYDVPLLHFANFYSY